MTFPRRLWCMCRCLRLKHSHGSHVPQQPTLCHHPYPTCFISGQTCSDFTLRTQRANVALAACCDATHAYAVTNMYLIIGCCRQSKNKNDGNRNQLSAAALHPGIALARAAIFLRKAHIPSNLPKVRSESTHNACHGRPSYSSTPEASAPAHCCRL